MHSTVRSSHCLVQALPPWFPFTARFRTNYAADVLRNRILRRGRSACVLYKK